MDFEAQGAVRLILLMFAGAVFAGAGLWLLMRPKPSGTAARIELFGLKFESSSAGVLVFLIGAGFMSLPLFVPEKAVVVPVQPGPEVDPGPDDNLGEPRVPFTPQPGAAALILPPDPEVEESEPNDRVQAANHIGLGQTVAGEVRKGDDDWFVVAAPAGPASVDLRVRKVSGGLMGARFLNGREERIGDATLHHVEAKYVRAEVPGNDRFYVRVFSDTALNETATYEITVLPVAD